MNSVPRILLFTLAFASWAVAELPKKAPITKYVGLWRDSPFTSKPPPPEPGPAVNPLEDYCLGGVSPISNGYRVTLMNKKKPEERIIVEPDRPSEGFSIVEVTRKPGDPLGTVVRLSSGVGSSAVTGTVSFDEKTLVLAAPPAAKAPPKLPHGVTLPGQPPQTVQPGQPFQPGQPGQASRGPRPRVVPPSPTGQPAQPAQPTQSSSSSTQGNQRPVHRGGR
jgi:hypothetical protein